MRLEIDLCIDEPVKIPINYQYLISRSLYQKLFSASKESASWLCSKGFSFGLKKFRLFNFSPLRIPDKEITDNGKTILVRSDRFSFFISTPFREIIRHLEVAFWKDRTFNIGSTMFRFGGLIGYPDFKFVSYAPFYTMSPLVVSKRVYRKGYLPRRAREVYLHPSDSDYFDCLKKNLEQKFLAYRSYLGHSILEIESSFRKKPPLSDFRICSKPRSKLITIKENTPAETKVRGYHFDFELSGSPEILSFAYAAGLGKLNSLGFGFIETTLE